MGLKVEYRIIVLTLIIATITSVIFYNRINDMAQPDEFDKEIAKIKGTEPEPNIEESMVYFLTLIYFLFIVLVGLINLYFYRRKKKKKRD